MAVFKSNGVCVKRARVKKTDLACGDDPVGDDPAGDDPVGDDPTEDPERERCCTCSQRSIIIPLYRHDPTDRSPLRRFCARAEHERCGVAVLAVSAPSSSRSTVIPPPTDPSSLPRNPRHSSRSHPHRAIRDTLPDPIPTAQSGTLFPIPSLDRHSARPRRSMPDSVHRHQCQILAIINIVIRLIRSWGRMCVFVCACGPWTPGIVECE